MYLIDTKKSCSVVEVNVDEEKPLVELPQEEQNKLVCLRASDYGKLIKWMKRRGIR